MFVDIISFISHMIFRWDWKVPIHKCTKISRFALTSRMAYIIKLNEAYCCWHVVFEPFFHFCFSCVHIELVSKFKKCSVVVSSVLLLSVEWKGYPTPTLPKLLACPPLSINIRQTCELPTTLHTKLQRAHWRAHANCAQLMMIAEIKCSIPQSKLWESRLGWIDSILLEISMNKSSFCLSPPIHISWVDCINFIWKLLMVLYILVRHTQEFYYIPLLLFMAIAFNFESELSIHFLYATLLTLVCIFV